MHESEPIEQIETFTDLELDVFRDLCELENKNIHVFNQLQIEQWHDMPQTERIEAQELVKEDPNNRNREVQTDFWRRYLIGKIIQSAVELETDLTSVVAPAKLRNL